MKKVLVNSVLATMCVFSTFALAQTNAPQAKPRPIVSTEVAPENITTKKLNDKQEISYSNMWADDKGQTHITKCLLTGLKLHQYAPPAAPDFIGVAPEDIESVVFTTLPVGYVGDWHHAPGPQWVITLSGQWEVQTTDGTTLRQGPGEFQFNSDQDAHATETDKRVGHTARQIGDVPNVRMIITLKKKPDQSYTNKACVL